MQPDSTQPVSAQPGPTQPDSTQLDSAQPDSTQPDKSSPPSYQGANLLALLDSFRIHMKGGNSIRPIGPADNAFAYALERYPRASANQWTVILRTGPDKASRPMACMSTRPSQVGLDLIVMGSAAFPTTTISFLEVRKHGRSKAPTYAFTVWTDVADLEAGASGLEEFVWMRTNGKETTELGGQGQGVKLVWAGTGEVVGVLAVNPTLDPDAWFVAFRGSGLTFFNERWRSVAAVTAVAAWDLWQREKEAAAAAASRSAMAASQTALNTSMAMVMTANRRIQ